VKKLPKQALRLSLASSGSGGAGRRSRKTVSTTAVAQSPNSSGRTVVGLNQSARGASQGARDGTRRAGFAWHLGEGVTRLAVQFFNDARALRGAKRELDLKGLLNPGVLIDP
jgi:hypothetical protein